jgi:hypothetical protein
MVKMPYYRHGTPKHLDLQRPLPSASVIAGFGNLEEHDHVKSQIAELLPNVRWQP